MKRYNTVKMSPNFIFYNKLFLDKEHRSSQYADDNLLTLDGLPKSLFIALENLDFFQNFQVLRLVVQKLKLFKLALNKYSKQVFNHTRLKQDWGSTAFVLLGIHFPVKLENIPE